MTEAYTTRNNFDQSLPAVESTLKNLEKLTTNLKTFNVMLGFDGYIDSLYRMVKNRKSQTDIEFYASMKDFGQRIIECAGSSGSIERILKKKLGGGFTTNTGRAIANMLPTAKVDLYGTFGFPTIDPIFPDSSPKNVSLHSVGNMGLTLAMEFNDGKIMSQDMEGIITLDWPTLLNRAGGKEGLITAFTKADVIGNGHWALMPYMNSYWEHIITDILPAIPKTALKKKMFFVDPADLQKRSAEDIRKMLQLLSKINASIPVVLSVNDREAIDVSKVLQKEGAVLIEKSKPKSYEIGGQEINKILGLSYFVIHDPHFATITGSKFHSWISEGFTSKPNFTTGAGDHFNGGVLLSLKAGLSPEEALVVANAATAIFVRTGQSPTMISLKKFIENYFYYILQDDNQFQMVD